MGKVMNEELYNDIMEYVNADNEGDSEKLNEALSKLNVKYGITSNP